MRALLWEFKQSEGRSLHMCLGLKYIFGIFYSQGREGVYDQERKRLYLKKKKKHTIFGLSIKTSCLIQ